MRRLALIELGPGMDVPSVRRMCENQRVPLIRINPRELGIPSVHDVGIADRALYMLQRLRNALV